MTPMLDHENRETDMHENGGTTEAAEPIEATEVEAPVPVAPSGEKTGEETASTETEEIQETPAGEVHAEIPREEVQPEHHTDEVHALEEAGGHPSELQESVEPAGDAEPVTAADAADQEKQLAENLQLKEALIVRAEELAPSTHWKSTAEALQALQAEWKAIGPVPREHGDAIWKRFRKSLDEFFGKRQEHYAKLRKEQEENLRKKEALCVRAEELSQSTQWKATSEAIKALQAEWKAVGPVPQKKADAIWKRFRGSIDVFFERQAGYFEQRNHQRDQRDADRRDQMLDALERKREQTHRLRESMARDEENVGRWQATLTNLRPGPNADETRVSLEAKIVDVEARLNEKRTRLDELEKSIQEIAAKLSAPLPKQAPAAAE
jgi:hypothetical protein